MVRSPEAGEVKTRLVPPLTPEEAVALYIAMVGDTFASLAELTAVDIHLAYTPEGAPPAKILNVLPHGVPVTIQEGNDLGERIYSVFDSLFSKGYARVAVIGSDSPDIPIDNVKDAFTRLAAEPGSVALGPAADGGYYLIAMDSLLNSPFVGIDWSTDVVFSQTACAIKETGLGLIELAGWYDIDIPADLRKLDKNPRAPKSAEFIRKNGILERI